MNYTKTILASVLTATLIGCGGGGGSSSGDNTSTATATKQGKVIDGYIQGATVFLDLNFNNTLDDGEPSAVTDENGDFNLNLTDTATDCGQYVPTVTLVPVGAIDSDFPDTPIDEAYKMVAPPSFAIATNEDLLNLTPLTSIVWDTVENELASADQTLTCEKIMEEQALRETISERLKQQEVRVAQRYNVTVAELYSDYVASGDTALHGFAQDLVPGLKKSYAETVALEKANPGANYAFVEYFLGMIREGANDYDNNWYRREYLATSPGNYTDTTTAVSDDLENAGEVYVQVKQSTVNNGIFEYEETVRLGPTADWDTNSPDYNCSISEAYREISTETQYGVTNGSLSSVPDNWNDCYQMDRTTTLVGQSITTRTVFAGSGDVYKTESNHSYNTPVLASLVGIGDNIDTLEAGWLTSQVNYIDPAFANSDAHEAVRWSRVENEYENQAASNYWDGYQIVRRRDSDDNYTVTTYYDDGTSTKQCGTWSSGGSDLTDCTK